jgi:N-acetylglucosamine kinase-like BadF-type ATPase
MSKNRVVIGIYCNESVTHSLVANAEHLVLSERKADPLIHHMSDPTRLVSDLNRVITEISKETGFGFDKIACVLIAVPGVNREQDANSIAGGLQKNWKRRKFKPMVVRVITTPVLALETLFPREISIYAYCDLDAYVVARNRRGEYLQAGGWGQAIPDPGSARAIFNKVMRYISEVYDGRAINSPFFKALGNRFSFDSAGQFYRASFAGNFTIIDVVNATFQAAGERDIAATSILDIAADEIVDLIRHTASRLPMDKKIPIVLNGRLFDEKIYTTVVQRKLSATLPQLSIVSNRFSVPDSAVEYAIDIAGRQLHTK